MSRGCNHAALSEVRIVGSTTDKVTGAANQVGGKIKEGVGKAIGNEQMEVEGKVQQVKGKVQKSVGDAKETIKDTVNKNL